MFRNQKQANEAIGVLLGLIDQDALWSADGPTSKFWEYYEQDGGPLSSGERVIVLAAGAMWSSTNIRLALATAYHRLDSVLAEALFSLLLAASRPNDSEAVEAWIGAWGTRRMTLR
jgi:hypothetical protein